MGLAGNPDRTEDWRSPIMQANASERLTVATLYDSQPWDAKWLMDVHHLAMQASA